MGVFGEAIYGHDGQYKARVYNAQYMRTADGRIQLGDARGLTEQDALNRLFARVSIGPQNDSAVFLSLDTEMKGYSWAVRAARQAGSSVSGGYYHAVYSESTLSSLQAADSFLYFPFIPNGEYCISLIRDPSTFNAQKRWEMNMQSVPVMQDARTKELGRPLHLSKDLMRRLLPYIVSKISVNARQYLYIRVPDQAPYEAYCLAVMHEILSLLPAGLRAGISAATNADPQQEQHFGILFQKGSFSARHETDIDLHRNAEYGFLNQVYISTPVKRLLEQFVDYPELVDKCYRMMEQQVFGDRLPKSFQSFENYYGISAIQKEQKRPSYLEECSRLLETTTEPTLRSILEKVILDEFKTPQDLDEAIERDPAFATVNTFAALTAYIQARNSILSYLGEHGIRYSAMFLYGRLNSIASGAGVNNALDFYEKVVMERQELRGLREAEQKQVLSDARDSAWQYFMRMRGSSVEGPGAQAAADQYTRLVNLDEMLDPSSKHPLSEINWFNRYQRTTSLNQYRDRPSPEAAAKILSIPDYDSRTGNPSCLTGEAAELIAFTRRIMEKDAETAVDPDAAGRRIDELIALEKVFAEYFRQWKDLIPEGNPERRSFYSAYEKALGSKAASYLAGNGATGARLVSTIRLASERMPHTGQEFIQEIERTIAQRIRNKEIPTKDRADLYAAALTSMIAPELQTAYSDWVATELRDGTMEAGELRRLYQSVRKPDEKLQALYTVWSDKKGLMEDMKASRTLVKYLSNLIKANGSVSSYEMKENREQMWRQLTIQEKTISAFTASIAYLYDKSADAVLRDPGSRRDSKILQDECNLLISEHGLGLFLDPNLSISELFENVREYRNWSNTANLVLYTKRNLASADMRMYQDLDGSTVYEKAVRAEDLQQTLNYLLCILDGKDYRYPGGKEVDTNRFMQELMGSPSLRMIMGLLESSRILKTNSDLGAELAKRGYSFSSGTGRGGISKPSSNQILAAAGVICILAFILGAVISHFAWPGKPAETVTRKPLTEEAASENSTAPAAEEAGSTGSSENGGVNTTGKAQPVVENAGSGETSNSAEGNDTETTQQQSDSTNQESQDAVTDDDAGNDTTVNENVEEAQNQNLLPAVKPPTDDADLRLTNEFSEQVKNENKITIEDNQILLPVYGLSKQSNNEIEDGYLVVQYSRWRYDPKKRQLVLKDPYKDVFIGYIRINGDEYSDSMVLSDEQWEELDGTSGEKNTLPSGVLSKIDEWKEQKDDLERYGISLTNYIENECKEKGITVKNVIFDEITQEYPFPPMGE